MDGHAWALILAVIALVLGVTARLPARRNGSRSAPLHSANLLLPCAIIIGTLPWVLRLGETVKIAASVTSIVLILAAPVLLMIKVVRKRRA